MEGKYNEVELTFIRNELHEHGDFILDLFVEFIEKHKLKFSGNLLDSLSYHVEQYGPNPTLCISFPSYGRFIEIRHYKNKKKNNRDLLRKKTNRYLWNIRSKNDLVKKKNTLWYTRNVYGSQNRLISRLGTEYTETMRTLIKNSIERNPEKFYGQSPKTYAV